CVTDTTLYAGWGDAVYIDAEGNTQSYWNFGTNSQLPALNLNGTLYRDSDSDGVIDHEDALPEDPTETRDFDQDGMGDNADIDDDGDGFDDTRDQFPFDGSEWSDRDGDGVGDNADRYPDDALDWADRDGDGIGDNADLYPDDGSDWADRDGDGVGDNADLYPDDAADWADRDGDGIGDNADLYPDDGADWADRDGDGVGDNADLYPDDASDWADRDGDGIGDNADRYPDDGSDWADRDGDGIGDNADRYPDDMDNDAIPDELDPDNAVDNGRPVMMPFDSDLSLAVSDDAGLFAELSETQFLEWKASAYAEDAVDASALLTYRVYLQGDELIADEDDIVRLPVGLHRVEWFASDLAGNMSEPMPQLIRIYPRARFEQAESLMGENAVADVWLSLSGPSPEYPVQFKLSIDQQLSTAEQSDVDAAFSLDAEHLVTLLPGADNTPATRAAFQLPIAVDSVFEQREILLINLEQSMIVSAEGRELDIEPEWQQHSLLITDENLPPEISLSVKQAGAETDVINRAAGDVSVEIRIVDPNGNDGHQIALNFGGLVAVAPNTRQVTFSPLGLTSGVYRVWINVTDDGVPALSSVLEKAIEVVDVEASTESADGNDQNEDEKESSSGSADGNDQNEDEKESSSGSSGGGSLIWLLTLSPVLLATRRWRLAKAA
ncbi:hypothetical protein I9W95_05715, partial [Thalassolituus marinus]|nr:hypothetical protein [Thalassolituus marinus]